jgi:hypothetical protein
MPGHKGIKGNENGEQLGKRGSLHPFIGSELTCGISDRVAGQVIRDWTCREHQEYWQSIPGKRHAKSYHSKLSDKRTVEFLNLTRSQARQVTGLLTGNLVT